MREHCPLGIWLYSSVFLVVDGQVIEQNGPLEILLSTQPQTPTNGVRSPCDCPWPPICQDLFLLDVISSCSHYLVITILCLINMHMELYKKVGLYILHLSKL